MAVAETIKPSSSRKHLAAGFRLVKGGSGWGVGGGRGSTGWASQHVLPKWACSCTERRFKMSDHLGMDARHQHNRVVHPTAPKWGCAEKRRGRGEQKEQEEERKGKQEEWGREIWISFIVADSDNVFLLSLHLIPDGWLYTAPTLLTGLVLLLPFAKRLRLLIVGSLFRLNGKKTGVKCACSALKKYKYS